MIAQRTLLIVALLAAGLVGCTDSNPASSPAPVATETVGPTVSAAVTNESASQTQLTGRPAWVDVAPCDTPGFACDQPAETEEAEPTVSVQVVENGYRPASDVIFGTFNFQPGQKLDPMIYRVGSDGEIKQAWRVTNKHGGLLGDRRLLPNGNFLFTIFKDGVYEMSPEGEIVWHYLDKGLSHHADMLPNGNILIAGIYCDCVKEIDYETRRPVWEWHAGHAFLDYGNDSVFPGGRTFGQKSAYASYSRVDLIKPDSWAHLNHAELLPNGNFLISLRNFDLVVEVNRDGQIVWSFGPGILKHQHTPRLLNDGTMAVFDNGNQRAMVVDRGAQQILWSAPVPEPAPVMGEVNRLADGNYKVVSSLANVIRVLSPEGNELWSMTVTPDAESGGIYRAHLPALEN